MYCVEKLFVFIVSLSVYRSSTNYYELLGVKSDATLEQIKNAFFDKSKKVIFLGFFCYFRVILVIESSVIIITYIY